MAERRTNQRHKVLRRAVAVLVAVPLVIAAFAGSSGAQDPTTTTSTIPPDANFTLSGIMNNGDPLTSGAVLDGAFAFCKNSNGLGSELYFEGSSIHGNGISIKHATVSPMVIPLHFGVVSITDPTNTPAISDDFVTLGVVDGSPAPFGTVGPSNVTYGGIAVAPSGGGMISFTYSDANSDCSDTRATQIVEPILTGDATTTTTTTAAPTTTTTTTAAPTTTTTTTAAPTTTTTTTLP
jgi:hypothetical protein